MENYSTIQIFSMKNKRKHFWFREELSRRLVGHKFFRQSNEIERNHHRGHDHSSAMASAEIDGPKGPSSESFGEAETIPSTVDSISSDAKVPSS